MQHVIKSENYIDGFRIHTLDIKQKGFDENVQLISSCSGEELQKDINTVYEIVRRDNNK